MAPVQNLPAGSAQDEVEDHKNGASFFGYKNHIKADAETSLIMDHRVTPANTRDSVV
ncbi:MAG: transposase [bacterium]